MMDIKIMIISAVFTFIATILVSVLGNLHRRIRQLERRIDEVILERSVTKNWVSECEFKDGIMRVTNNPAKKKP